MDEKTTTRIVNGFKANFDTEFMKKFFEELEEEEKRKKEMIDAPNYIKWLENFVKEHPQFSDDTWLYKQDEISSEDYENVCRISTFFSAISDFANANYIEGTYCDYGQYYLIEYNGKVYEIGTIVGQGAVSFCNTQDVNNEATVIKFEELANPSSAIRVRTVLVENQLARIDDLFRNLINNKELNISIEAIAKRVNKALEELEKK